MTDPNNFLKAPPAPIYTNFEGGGGGGSARQKNAAKNKGGARAKKKIFWSKFSKKCLKTPLFLAFFQKFTCSAENLVKLVSLKGFWRAQKINLVDQKRSTKFSIFFENPPPPFREISRSAPGTMSSNRKHLT